MKSDLVLIRGVATVRSWEEKALLRKTEIEQELIRQGLAGIELETEAVKILRCEALSPIHEAIAENSLVNAGTNALALALTGGSFTTYNNANAALGVGDSSTAFNLSQTNLQGTTNVTDRIRKAMDATFPSVTGAVASFRSTFGTSDANFAWNEWALFNNVVDGSGTMLNRSVTSLGTKTSAAAWQLSATITFS